MRFVSCTFRERWLRLYGHVARFPDADPAHQILSARESCEWKRPMGRPRASWLQQVDRHLKELGMGQASTWGMARWRPLEYRQKVDTGNPTTHTQMQLLKRNTFNENIRIFTKDNNSKGNDNN